MLSALHAGGFKAPQLQCGVLPCDYGGMPCVPSTQADTDVFKTLLALNNMSGDCFAIHGMARGSEIDDRLIGGPIFGRTSPVQYNNSGHFDMSSNFSAQFNKNACYLKIRDINSTNPYQHLNHTKNVLCTAGLVPTGYDPWLEFKGGVDPVPGRLSQHDLTWWHVVQRQHFPAGWQPQDLVFHDPAYKCERYFQVLGVPSQCQLWLRMFRLHDAGLG
jgi:hypothetical protein